MKKYFRPPRDYYDEEVKAAKKTAREKDLPWLLERGTEKDIAEYARKQNPKATKEDLEEVVKLFLAARREREGDS